MTATAVHQQPATDPDGPTGQLASWVAGLTLDDIPQAVVERAKHLLLDGLGCGLIGAQLPWSRIATDAVLDLENSGDTVVIGTGKSTSGPAAAVLNGAHIVRVHDVGAMRVVVQVAEEIARARALLKPGSPDHIAVFEHTKP